MLCFSACAQRQWVEIRRENCQSVCWASGDPHYRTFDGASYDFMGSCNFIMVKHENYLIKSENTPCGSTGVTCTKSVTVEAYGLSFKLNHGSTVTLNNATFDSADTSFIQSGVALVHAGLFSSLSFAEFGLSIMWDGGITDVM